MPIGVPETVRLAGARILLVEDDPHTRQAFVDLFHGWGYEVKAVENLSQADLLLRDFAPDLLILDLFLPEGDAIPWIQNVRSRFPAPELPILVLTVYDTPALRERALAAGATDFVSKASTPTEIRLRVEKMLAMRFYHRELQNMQSYLESVVEERTRELIATLEELRRAQLETLFRLGRAAEFRDDETGRHILRVSHVSYQIARSLGLEEQFCQDVLYTSPLHDVGKIGIPDRILLKPGRLTDEERKIMQAHTVIGAEILKGESRLDQMAQTIALTHHERWDGRGYPRGLRETEIPLEGRLVAVADVFDALVSRRVYKPPMPWDKALKILEEERAHHFDPEMVDAFLGVLDEVRRIYDQFRDEEQSRPLLQEILEGRLPI